MARSRILGSLARSPIASWRSGPRSIRIEAEPQRAKQQLARLHLQHPAAPVPAHATVAGVPAKVVGNTGHDAPALSMDQHFDGDEGCTVCPVRGPQHG